MSARGRIKPRRRELASHRYFHQQCGYSRVPPTRGAVAVPHKTGSQESARVTTRSNLGGIEMKKIMRLDGDSIAYFWALENETTISHETLRAHWRMFVNVLVK
jgi:hypothetical protein